jgi:hypothetical protein
MTTEKMLAYVQCLLMYATDPRDKTVAAGIVERLTRIEDYLIRRFNCE